MLYQDYLDEARQNSSVGYQKIWNDSAREWFYKQQEAALAQKYALQSAGVQNEFQLAQWNRENAYNDPSAVRARYENAGISPIAAFGSGAASGAGIASSVNTGSVGSGSSSGSYGHDTANKLRSIELIADAAQQAVHAGLSIAQTKSSINVADSQAELNNANALKISQEARQSAATFTQRQELLAEQIKNMKQDTLVKESESLLNEAKKENLITESEYNRARTIEQDYKNRINSFREPYDKEKIVRESHIHKYELKSAIQEYNFNAKKNPLLVQQYEFNLKSTIVDIMCNSVQAKLAKEKIDLTKQQVLTEISRQETFKAAAKKAYEQATTESELRGYKKAESIIGNITSVADSAANVVGALKSIAYGASSTTTTNISSQDEQIIENMVGMFD